MEKAPSSSPEKTSNIWRMHQSTEKKYQLFPRDRQQPTASPGKSLDPEQAFAHAMGQNTDKADKAAPGSGLRIRIKEHNLIRRRKVSVPELGPMTTVQEAAMDSRKFLRQNTYPCWVPETNTLQLRYRVVHLSTRGL
jgi:hypothetical protein